MNAVFSTFTEAISPFYCRPTAIVLCKLESAASCCDVSCYQLVLIPKNPQSSHSIRSSFGSDLGQLYFILFCEPCLVQFCHLGGMRCHAVTETLSFHFSPLKSNQFILEPKKTFVTNLRKFPWDVLEISVHKNGMDGGTVNLKTQCVQLWLSPARMHKNTWHWTQSS